MNTDYLDGGLDLMFAKIELEGETCGLKHSKVDPAEDHPAINYLCQKLGDQRTGTPLQETRIPICEECVEALSDPDWILMYCMNCHKSQWVFRPYAKLEYPEGNGIYFLDVCPFCAEIADKYEGE